MDEAPLILAALRRHTEAATSALHAVHLASQAHAILDDLRDTIFLAQENASTHLLDAVRLAATARDRLDLTLQTVLTLAHLAERYSLAQEPSTLHAMIETTKLLQRQRGILHDEAAHQATAQPPGSVVR